MELSRLKEGLLHSGCSAAAASPEANCTIEVTLNQNRILQINPLGITTDNPKPDCVNIYSTIEPNGLEGTIRGGQQWRG